MKNKAKTIGFISGALFCLMGDKLKSTQPRIHADAQSKKKKLTVLGTGWGAMSLLRDIDCSKYDVTVISPRNYFLFTPLLNSSTVGTLELRTVLEPVRDYIKGKPIKYLEAKCLDVDFEKKELQCEATGIHSTGAREFQFDYDLLVVSVGAVPNTFGQAGVVEYCHFVKEIEDARKLRERILKLMELASLPNTTEEEKKKLLTFAVVGGGPTGVEFTAELIDFLHSEVPRYYPDIANYISVVLVQSNEHLLNTFAEDISIYTENTLKREKVKVLTNYRVTEVGPGKLTIKAKASGETETIPFGLCVWSTGITASPLTKKLISKMPDQTSRIALRTDPYLQVISAPNVYAIGDCGTIVQRKLLQSLEDLFHEGDVNHDGVLTRQEFVDILKKKSDQYPQIRFWANKLDDLFEKKDLNKDGVLNLEEFKGVVEELDSKLTAFPATAQVASQEGAYLARSLNQDQQPPQPFVYKHKGSLAYLGHHYAVAEMDGHHLHGKDAWLAWRGIYWSKQVTFTKRVNLMFNWMKTAVFGRDISHF